MTAPIAAREIVDRARGLIAWVFGFAVLLGLTIATYPSIRDEPGIRAFAEEIPAALRAFTGGEEFDFSTAEGLINSRLLAFLLPLLILVWAIGFGARAIAGEHEDGRLDLVLSYPVTRRRALAEKLLVLVVVLGLFCTVILLWLTVGGLSVDLGLRSADVLAACVMLFALGALFGTMTLAAGAITLTRSVTIAVAGGYAAFAYFLDSLSVFASWLEPLRPLSAFYWYGRVNPLIGGLDVTGLAVLVCGTLAAGVVAFVSFERRDLA